MSRAAELERRRAHACRLTPDRALETLDDALAFLDERGLLTLTPDCALPSLFGACHEEPYSTAPGFGRWPKTKWWWGGALEQRPGVLWTRLRRGKGLFLAPHVAQLFDPLCRRELARADAGEHGAEAERLVQQLAAAGPSLLEELKEEVGIDKRVRARLERRGAIVGRSVRVELEHGDRHTTELRRWDQALSRPHHVDEPLRELLVAGVRAAVLAPEREALRWFTWTVPPEAAEDDRLERPERGWLAAA